LDAYGDEGDEHRNDWSAALGGGGGTPEPPPLAPLAETEDDVPLAARMPRYCGTCGAPWQPQWAECAPCAAVAARRAGGASVARARTRASAPADASGIIHIRSAIKLYFSLLAVSVAGMVAILAGAPELQVELFDTLAFSIVVLIWCGVRNPRSVVALFRPARPRWYLLAVGAALCTVTVAFVVVETLHRVLELEKLQYSQPFLDAGYGLWVVVLVVCVQPALFEELAFRGVMLSSLRPTLSDTEAVLVSAMLFMTLHISPAAFPHTLAMGIAAGMLRLASGSILPCIVMHFVHNSIVIVAERVWNF
jgi:membrane protease YdiL (CAAX protease family)